MGTSYRHLWDDEILFFGTAFWGKSFDDLFSYIPGIYVQSAVRFFGIDSPRAGEDTRQWGPPLDGFGSH